MSKYEGALITENGVESLRQYEYRRLDSSHTLSRSLVARNISVAVLVVTWCAGLACLIGGATFLDKTSAGTTGWIRLSMSRSLKESIPLLINIVVTILTEGTGFIHATTLRWALGDELIFNSNLRLFSRVRGSWAFGGLSNFLNAGFLILSYAATSLIFASFPASDICDAMPLNGYDCKPENNINTSYVSPGAIMALGCGLTGISALTTWQFFSSKVETWFSSPIETAWASVLARQRVRRGYRCMMSVHESTHPPMPLVPKPRQDPAWSAHAEVRRILIYLWILAALVVAWFVSLLIAIEVISRKCKEAGDHCNYVDYYQNVYAGSSWSLLPDTGGLTSVAKISTLDDAGGQSHTGLPQAAGFTIVFLLIMGFQSVITMGLHCADLLVNMSRDEDTWRTAYSTSGYTSQMALITALRSWKSVFLFALKPLVHWFFGLGMTFYLGWGIFMRPPQTLYTSLTVLALAFFSTYLCFERPKGPQPATFGHLQTLVDLIDDWSEPMHWGHKGGYSDGIFHAGTARTILDPILIQGQYAS